MDKDDKSAKSGGVKKRKLSPNIEPEPKGWLRSGKKRSDELGLDHPDETVAMENRELSNFNLPTELLAKIINLVPISQWSSFESVNRQFQDVVHGLWGQLHEIRLDELVCNKKQKAHEIVKAILEKIFIRAPKVTWIRGFDEFFSRSTPIRFETIELLSKFQHLQTIDFLGGEVISTGNFGFFLKSSASWKSWKRMDFTGGIIWDGISGNLTISNASDSKDQPALNWEYLKFSPHTSGIFDSYLQVDWSRLKKLVIGDEIQVCTCAKDILSIIRLCIQISHLEIDFPDCRNGQPSFGEFMKAIAALENLSVLEMDCYSSKHKVFRGALLMLIRYLGLRHITSLSLSEFYCSDQTVYYIIDHLPHLKSLQLDVTKCTKTSLEHLANRMVHLESLKLRTSIRRCVVDGSIVRDIGENMTNLQCLHLDYLPNVNSQDFINLANLRNLKELRITGKLIESETLESWAGLGFGSCLTTLELCLLGDGVSSETMGNFLKNMPRLHSMTLKRVTDEILKAIVEFCPMLTELIIEWSSITSNGVQSVIDHCSLLKILKVRGCSAWFPEALKVGKYRKITFKSLSNKWYLNYE